MSEDGKPASSHLLVFASLTLIVSAFTLLGAWGCDGESKGGATTAGARWDSAGIEMVDHPRLSGYGQPTYGVEYLMAVSDTLPDGAGEFGKVSDVALLDDGNLAVLDELAAEVRVFSPGGTLLRRVGRKGQGPGELSGNWTLGILPLSSGRMALPDVVNQAIIVFDSMGEHETNIPWNVMEETIPRWRVLVGDTVLVQVITEDAHTFVKRTLDGGRRDTIRVVEVFPPDLPPSEQRTPLFQNHLLWAATGAPPILATSFMEEPVLTMGRGDSLTRVIRWDPGPRDLSEEEREVLLRVVARSMGDPEGAPETALRYFIPPRRAPALADLEVGSGFLMTQRLRPFQEMDQRILSTLGAEGYGGPVWDVFALSGAYLGRLDFGENVEVFGVRGDTIVGVREDSMAVVHPFVARLPRDLRDRIGEGQEPHRGGL